MGKKKNTTTTTETVTRWEYEYKGSAGNHWIPEDDERSASYKATGNLATGRIRSKVEVITVESSPWEVKQQTLVEDKAYARGL